MTADVFYAVRQFDLFQRNAPVKRIFADGFQPVRDLHLPQVDAIGKCKRIDRTQRRRQLYRFHRGAAVKGIAADRTHGIRNSHIFFRAGVRQQDTLSG